MELQEYLNKCKVLLVNMEMEHRHQELMKQLERDAIENKRLMALMNAARLDVPDCLWPALHFSRWCSHFLAEVMVDIPGTDGVILRYVADEDTFNRYQRGWIALPAFRLSFDEIGSDGWCVVRDHDIELGNDLEIAIARVVRLGSTKANLEIVAVERNAKPQSVEPVYETVDAGLGDQLVELLGKLHDVFHVSPAE